MKKILIIAMVTILSAGLIGCEASGSTKDRNNTMTAAGTLQENQPTPTDIDYSLERYNLIRRAYWVNGQREKASSLVCEIEKPLGYIVAATLMSILLGVPMWCISAAVVLAAVVWEIAERMLKR